MALTKTLKPSKTTTTSIIKTRAQSRTAGTTARTGTNDRVIDSAAPVAVGTTGRPTDVNPAPVTDDLFAGRPKTGALKGPPLVPTPRNRDSDSDDDAKKPAAKPKPKPKGRRPKASTTRKPRKSRAAVVDANELVDPMSQIGRAHV